MESLHNTGISGKLGRHKTYETVRRKFHWLEMANFNVNHVIFSARRKPGPGFGKSPLHSSLLQSTRPLDRIAIDN